MYRYLAYTSHGWSVVWGGHATAIVLQEQILNDNFFKKSREN